MTNINASGLSAEETKKLPSRSVKSEEEEMLSCIKELYECKAQDSSFRVYADNAIFHDPVGIAEGIKHIREQFFGLAKLFPKATIDKFEVLENPSSVPASKTLVNQDVTYYTSSKPVKTMNSLLTLERDSSGKLIKHNEDWDHTGTSTKEDGFFGMLNEYRKKGTVAATSPFLKS